MARVTMYSRTACGLCDEARETILAAHAEHPFEYEEIFVDGHDDLERAYGLRVPVILLDGEEAFELQVDADQLRHLLGASRRLRD